MIVVDSSVWIDFFRAVRSPQTELLDEALGADRVMIGDLIMVEVLQGFANEATARRAHARLMLAIPLTVGDLEVAALAARHYRFLRGRGITPRKTIDTLIATRCIVDGLPLLYSDRDFEPFVQHLGLRSALDIPGAS
ncbi:PIN domain nuclease [Sphingomonas sp. KR1UV-12]|uniref:Ribonuclease VapC n=1 Tax=Sphingomonas aurea TaxID=3063994 RepID=A0ABT9EIY6_9SPHN|nr:PIN domain nuclease [Sphingomonas sp. KR1UV-12]MDP1026920.1 PIN domain nuclease [Sphingomonas sp. KR1UV-12]